jgi:hypothetical protein
MATHNDWIIDDRVNVTGICRSCNWHYASVLKALSERGYTREDAEVFARFAFADHARKGERPEDQITTEHWERLSLAE